MSKIDLAALRRIVEGDPGAKVAVNRKWLAAVLAELEELERIRSVTRSVDPIVDMLRKVYGGAEHRQ